MFFLELSKILEKQWPTVRVFQPSSIGLGCCLNAPVESHRVAVYRNLKACMGTGTTWRNCIQLISNAAQMHYDTTVGCYLEAPVKGGGITWQRAWALWTRDARPSWPENESGQNKLPSWQSEPQLGNMFEKWTNFFWKWKKIYIVH